MKMAEFKTVNIGDDIWFVYEPINGECRSYYGTLHPITRKPTSPNIHFLPKRFQAAPRDEFITRAYMYLSVNPKDHPECGMNTIRGRIAHCWKTEEEAVKCQIKLYKRWYKTFCEPITAQIERAEARLKVIS